MGNGGYLGVPLRGVWGSSLVTMLTPCYLGLWPPTCMLLALTPC